MGGNNWKSCHDRDDPCACGGASCIPADDFLCISCGGGKITGIALSNNGLVGREIPAALFNLTSLTSLGLTKNSIRGTIPSTLGNLIDLTVLELTETHISGTIPAEIGELKNLTYVVLNQNVLTGTAPSELAGLTKLRMLSLWGNLLQGPVPALPFAQYDVDCFLDNPGDCKGGGTCNHFACPLPAGSSLCIVKGSGIGVHCK
jgi:hypothetical protein